MARTRPKKPARRIIPLREDFVRGASPLRVDREAGVIRGVKILGTTSQNKRRYLPEAVQRAAKLYEGCPVNADHPTDAHGNLKPDRSRSAYDRLGKLQNVEARDDGLYGDLVLLKTHPLAERVMEAAERMPEAFGLSHNSDGRGHDDDAGVFVVEEITEVRSVDLVADPATNKSLFESRTMPQTTLRKLIEAARHLRPRRRKALLEEGDDMGDMMDAPMDEPAAEPAAEGDWKADLVAAIGKLVSSESDEDHKVAQKIMAMLKPAAAEPVIAEGDDEEEEEDEKETAEDRDSKGHGIEDDADEKERAGVFGAMKKRGTYIEPESRQPKKPAPGARPLTEDKAKRLCKLAGIAEDKDLLEALTGSTEDNALKILEWAKTRSGPAPARSSAPRSSAPGSPAAPQADALYREAVRRITGREPAPAKN